MVATGRARGYLALRRSRRGRSPSPAGYRQLPQAQEDTIVAARTPFQRVTSESIRIEPQVDWSLVPLGDGTHQLIRLTAHPGFLTVSYQATVTVEGYTAPPSELTEVSFDEVPSDVLPYLNPSRYCESDELGGFAQRIFGDMAPGHNRVQAVTDWVTANLSYLPGSTTSTSSTTDVLIQRVGVCRDYAHVAISLCRALGVPARYVSGYGVGVEPQDFHGFFEAYIGAGWYLFDPTAMAMGNGLVRSGYGRDAADAPFATLVGQASLYDKHVEVTAEEPIEPGPATTSTA